MGLTNFPNGVSSMGVPLNAGGNPFGSTWFVAASGGSDGNRGSTRARGRDRRRVASSGRPRTPRPLPGPA